MASPEVSTRRIALVVQYLGTHFYGLQRQPNLRTVQSELEAAIEQIVGLPVTIHAAGRTDTGVHAAAQVVHFNARSLIPPQRWARVLNSRLPDDLLTRASAEVDSEWHACFSATWRRYRYTIYNDRCPNLFLKPYVWHYYQHVLDEERMRQALEPLQGHHSLEAFQRAGSSRPHAWVDVQEVQCRRRAEFVEIEVQASGFLYGMMRLLVGLLVRVGVGDCSLREFYEIWTQRQRHLVKHSAPARGLCLMRVGYSNNPFPPEAWIDAQPAFIFLNSPGRFG
jgi:tRNA pseudouridine38-40 synthase